MNFSSSAPTRRQSNSWTACGGGSRILQPALESSIYLERLPLRLLARALKSQDKAVETERLYNWLSVGISDTHGVRICDEDAVREIRSWLEERPHLYKKVYAEGLNRCDESDNSDFEICALKIEWRFYNAKPPPDFGVWCLKHAAVVADTKPDVALHMLQRAVIAYQNRWGSRGLSLDRLSGLHSETSETQGEAGSTTRATIHSRCLQSGRQWRYYIPLH